MAEWGSARTYTQRVANISNGAVVATDASFGSRLNGAFYLIPDATVFDDNAVDRMSGATGSDWFFGYVGNQVGRVKDVIGDLTAPEVIDPLD